MVADEHQLGRYKALQPAVAELTASSDTAVHACRVASASSASDNMTHVVELLLQALHHTATDAIFMSTT